MRAWRSSSQCDNDHFTPEAVLCCGHYADLFHEFSHFSRKNCSKNSTIFKVNNLNVSLKRENRKKNLQQHWKIERKAFVKIFTKIVTHVLKRHSWSSHKKYIVNVFLLKRQFLTLVDRLNLSKSGGNFSLKISQIKVNSINYSKIYKKKTTLSTKLILKNLKDLIIKNDKV